MISLEEIRRPSKEEQIVAKESYESLMRAIDELKDNEPEIEIEETGETMRIPRSALVLLSKILEAMGKGQPFSVVPVATELTTQASAEFLGCSRPHLVKLLEEGKIPFTKVGKHRRVLFKDLVKYKDRIKMDQEKRIIEMMRVDEELGLYDS